MIQQWWAGHHSWGHSQISRSGGAQGWSLHSHARTMLRGTQHSAPSPLGPVLSSCCYRCAGAELLLSLPMKPGSPLPSPALTWGLPQVFLTPSHPLAMGLHACTLGCTELPHPLSPSASPSHMLLSSPPTAATSWWVEAPLPPCTAASRHSFSSARFRGNAASDFLVRTPQTRAPICP